MEDHAMLSYLSSGFPASASESARLLGMISGSGLFVLMCCIALLAFVPSWPLAVGTVAVAAVVEGEREPTRVQG